MIAAMNTSRRVQRDIQLPLLAQAIAAWRNGDAARVMAASSCHAVSSSRSRANTLRRLLSVALRATAS